MSMLKKSSAVIAALMFTAISPSLASVTAFAAGEEEIALEAKLDDARITRVVSAATDQIIFNAKYAQRHAKNQQVVDYANQMLREHQRFAEEFSLIVKRSGVAPEESVVSILWRIAGLKNLAALHLAKPEQFDQLFLEQTAQYEQRLADLLQEKLIPETQHQNVRTYLQSMRGDMVDYVDQANQLIAEFGS